MPRKKEKNEIKNKVDVIRIDAEDEKVKVRKDKNIHEKMDNTGNDVRRGKCNVQWEEKVRKRR